MFRVFIAGLALVAAMPAYAQAPAYHSSIEDFDRFAAETAAMPPAERVTAFRATFNALVPGFYAPRGAPEDKYRERVRKALEAYPAQRERILATARDFKIAYESGNARFLRFFPGYKPSMPIYLLHSLGEMDGGTREIDGRTVAVFGADVIARIHDSSSIGPLLDHELFHFYHADAFPECKPLWCSLWTEGLATYVAGQVNPGADDRTLMLTIPRPIRPEVEPRLTEAMCYTRARLESTDEKVYGAFFYGNGVSAFPPRFGYLIGYLLTQKIAEGRSLESLASMPGAQVKPLIEQALARYDCPPAA
ncbi:MAG: hypothetical protein EOP60_09020 [Sphingomonadales bacterium]|nr:MAG: hypothetical protein EOP60_09020 [Sphingomonadales bacterium]